MSKPSWQDDLFGGRNKGYVDSDGNVVYVHQDPDSRAENEARGKGDYPHYTNNHKGDESWHYSSDKDTHEHLYSYGEDNDSEQSSEQNDTIPLF
jgi:hypothetical protein